MSQDFLFQAMQKAVDIVNDSPHPTNKVAASLLSRGNKIVSHTNYWPAPIANNIGLGCRIGNSSGTVHAETATILTAENTQGAGMFITDPFCPNCAKNIAEAGIKDIYIDHKGFEKDFWERRSGSFKNMSMEIVARAGISVFRIHRKDRRIDTIHTPDVNYIPKEDSPLEIEQGPKSQDFFEMLIAHKYAHHYNRKIAIGLAENSDGTVFGITSRVHAVTGYSLTNDNDVDMILQAKERYSFMQEPINRYLMACKRLGLTPLHDYLFCSQVPSAREMVNAVGAGFSKLYLGDPFKSRDQSGIQARDLLRDKGVMTFVTFKK